jgi:flagellar basal-body rod protein FlgG
MWTWKSYLRFTLRELLLLSVIVGLALSNYLNYSPFRHTGNPLNMAIDGDGYFCLTDERAAGIVFTRCGVFIRDENGMLAMRAGGTVWRVSPSICIPADSTAISITPNGCVLCGGSISSKVDRTGQLQLALFHRPEKLNEIAPSVFADTAESGPALLEIPGREGAGLVRQGMLRRDAFATHR